jgi:hypothetical protein
VHPRAHEHAIKLFLLQAISNHSLRSLSKVDQAELGVVAEFVKMFYLSIESVRPGYGLFRQMRN